MNPKTDGALCVTPEVTRAFFKIKGNQQIHKIYYEQRLSLLYYRFDFGVKTKKFAVNYFLHR